MSAEVRLADGPLEVEQALELRKRVFCGEQGVSLDAERDGRDAEGSHLLALDAGAIVGTCRLLLDRGAVRLSRMAVEADHRRQGLGRAMLDAADDWARTAGAQRISLHAQLPARPLYEGSGYEARGRHFVEEGIEHVLMEKALSRESARA